MAVVFSQSFLPGSGDSEKKSFSLSLYTVRTQEGPKSAASSVASGEVHCFWLLELRQLQFSARLRPLGTVRCLTKTASRRLRSRLASLSVRLSISISVPICVPQARTRPCHFISHTRPIRAEPIRVRVRLRLRSSVLLQSQSVGRPALSQPTEHGLARLLARPRRLGRVRRTPSRVHGRSVCRLPVRRELGLGLRATGRQRLRVQLLVSSLFAGRHRPFARSACRSASAARPSPLAPRATAHARVS